MNSNVIVFSFKNVRKKSITNMLFVIDYPPQV